MPEPKSLEKLSSLLPFTWFCKDFQFTKQEAATWPHSLQTSHLMGNLHATLKCSEEWQHRQRTVAEGVEPLCLLNNEFSFAVNEGPKIKSRFNIISVE
jgi:hypothetical protein